MKFHPKMCKVYVVQEGKKRYLPLLLIGDEQENMIDRYLSRGVMYVLQVDGQDIGVCVVTDEGSGWAEVKNLAIAPAMQRKGYGSYLLQAVLAQLQAAHVRLGTGDVPGTLSFYQQLGFQVCGRIPGFFRDHYDHPIVEDGVTLCDMVYLQKDLD